MFNQSAFVLLLSIGLILLCTSSNLAASNRKSNANDNIFNLLLGLYKLNPLKGSQVFQSFSNNLLMGMGHGKKDSFILNIESVEGVKVNEQVKTNLNEIEKIIHTKNKKQTKHYEKPAYDLDDVGTENFTANVVIDDKILLKEELQRSLDNHDNKDDFSALFEHVGSKENNIEIPVTKLLPINNIIIQYLQRSNPNETVFGLKVANSKSGSHIGTLAKDCDRNPEEVPMDNLVEGMGDVIVL